MYYENVSSVICCLLETFNQLCSSFDAADRDLQNWLFLLVFLLQNHSLRLPQRSLQTGGRSGHQHLHLVCWHHQSRAHPVRLGGAGSGQFSGPQTTRDAGSGAAIVWHQQLCRGGGGWGRRAFATLNEKSWPLKSPKSAETHSILR